MIRCGIIGEIIFWQKGFYDWQMDFSSKNPFWGRKI